MSADVELWPHLVTNAMEKVFASAMITELPNVSESKRGSMSDQNVGVLRDAPPPVRFFVDKNMLFTGQC